MGSVVGSLVVLVTGELVGDTVGEAEDSTGDTEARALSMACRRTFLSRANSSTVRFCICFRAVCNDFDCNSANALHGEDPDNSLDSDDFVCALLLLEIVWMKDDRETRLLRRSRENIRDTGLFWGHGGSDDVIWCTDT